MFTIAFITSYAPSLVNFRAALIRSLIERGVQVLAFAPNFDEETYRAVQALGATPIECPLNRTGMNPVVDLWNTLRMVLLLRKYKPDLTLSYFIKPVIFGTTAAWLARVPLRFSMVEGLGFVFTESNKNLSIKRRLLKWLVVNLYKFSFSRSKRVIFLNPDDRNELLSAGILQENKAFLLGGIGVDLKVWPKEAPVSQPVSFLLVARLLHEKGVGNYAEAARLVKRDCPDVRFVLLGGLDDNPGAITKEDVEGWVREGILEWHGHVPVRSWLAQTSVYVLPSYREGVPVSTQEALATGRPVITTNVPGCRETVDDGVNGFLVPPRDSSALAEKMLVFIRQPELIGIMGEASRHIAEKRFDVHLINKRLIDMLFENIDIYDVSTE